MRAEHRSCRLLTVWGGPGCGKTTLAAKLAVQSEARRLNTIVLLCDDVTPELPMLAEIEGADDARRSLGLLLDSTGRDRTNALYDSLLVAKGFSRTAFLGYTYGENPLSYPPPTKGQARAVLSAAMDVCDVVIVSAPTTFCASALAMAAAALSDLSVCVVSPGIKSLAYLSSNRRVYPDRTVRSESGDDPERVVPGSVTAAQRVRHDAARDGIVPGSVTVDNHPDERAIEPYPSHADFVLPFSAEIQAQGRERRLLEPVRSREGTAYQRVVADIYDRFMSEEEDEHER
jgi:hypothetical protein